MPLRGMPSMPAIAPPLISLSSTNLPHCKESKACPRIVILCIAILIPPDMSWLKVHLRSCGFVLRNSLVSIAVGRLERTKEPPLRLVMRTLTASLPRDTPNVTRQLVLSMLLSSLRSSPSSPTRSRTMPLCDIRVAHCPVVSHAPHPMYCTV